VRRRAGASEIATTAPTIAIPINVAIARWPAALQADWPRAWESRTTRQVIEVVNSAYSIASRANENRGRHGDRHGFGRRDAAERDRRRGSDDEPEERPGGPHGDPLDGLGLLRPQHEQHWSGIQ
jgi:hypothetical protein